MRLFLIGLLLLLSAFATRAQNRGIGRYLGDETPFLAETKQLTQFIRRFNAEENKAGKLYRTTDPEYRKADNRLAYINILFDGQNAALTPSLKQEFAQAAVNSDHFLNFHSGEWFAEASVSFMYKGQREQVRLLMQLEQENLGYKWVIANAWTPRYGRIFPGNAHDPAKFLHPMSHEIGFINLVDAFQSSADAIEYVQKDFSPDYLSIFMYELQQGLLSFKNVDGLKFHFFDVDNWYFEVSQFNRSGLNRGWLISALTKIEPTQKELMKEFLLKAY